MKNLWKYNTSICQIKIKRLHIPYHFLFRHDSVEHHRESILLLWNISVKNQASFNDGSLDGRRIIVVRRWTRLWLSSSFSMISSTLELHLCRLSFRLRSVSIFVPTHNDASLMFRDALGTSGLICLMTDRKSDRKSNRKSVELESLSNKIPS